VTDITRRKIAACSCVDSVFNYLYCTLTHLFAFPPASTSGHVPLSSGVWGVRVRAAFRPANVLVVVVVHLVQYRLDERLVGPFLGGGSKRQLCLVGGNGFLRLSTTRAWGSRGGGVKVKRLGHRHAGLIVGWRLEKYLTPEFFAAHGETYHVPCA
jgi:hypothetical protein